jgi:hypothetical protein
MRDEIVRQDVQIKKEVGNMRALQSLSSAIVGQCADADTKALAQNIADEFMYSDPVTSEQTKQLETELHNQLSELQKAVMESDDQAAKALANSIMVNLKERNRICALSK